MTHHGLISDPLESEQKQHARVTSSVNMMDIIYHAHVSYPRPRKKSIVSRKSDAGRTDDRYNYYTDVESSTYGNQLQWMEEYQMMIGNDSSEDEKSMGELV